MSSCILQLFPRTVVAREASMDVLGILAASPPPDIDKYRGTPYERN